ncbi:hypothetical protein DLM45_11755 [Hyphomicrobium methylovorum]|nr:hypothetical protein [Hyphomicrobium methylovorum]
MWTPFGVSGAWADEAGTNALAAELRAQGFSCAKAEHAVRNAKLSVPNETVWEITCDNGVYRMTVVPDMAAKIERLKK